MAGIFFWGVYMSLQCSLQLFFVLALEMFLTFSLLCSDVSLQQAAVDGRKFSTSCDSWNLFEPKTWKKAHPLTKSECVSTMYFLYILSLRMHFIFPQKILEHDFFPQKTSHNGNHPLPGIAFRTPGAGPFVFAGRMHRWRWMGSDVFLCRWFGFGPPIIMVDKWESL